MLKVVGGIAGKTIDGISDDVIGETAHDGDAGGVECEVGTIIAYADAAIRVKSGVADCAGVLIGAF
ncbi:MAG: hypothetical protein KDD45_02315 [Bdellovibrionales bacterium]|nr:hypothetical protein [Bdellovibrionales bacterium]